MDIDIKEKAERLKEEIRSYGCAAVAFSGGVDSTFLLEVTHEVLGEQTLALTAASYCFPQREYEETVQFCKAKGIRQMIIPTDELSIKGFQENTKDRCYLCKRELFKRFQKAAAQQGIGIIMEGTNRDDLQDYRPGLRAIKELGIKSPLVAAGLTKQEIRKLSEQLALPTWKKPSYACLATRIAYEETITREKLALIERAEQFLIDIGFSQMRVRMHGNLARIELLPDDIPRFLQEEVRTQVYRELKSYGFAYISMDLVGYRTGSMNK